MPMLPFLCFEPCMMPILHSPGVITPGQLGPMRCALNDFSAAFTFSMSTTGMPSVMLLLVVLFVFVVFCFVLVVFGVGLLFLVVLVCVVFFVLFLVLFLGRL